MAEQTNRDKLLERIANLRAKASNDGATEAEANAAMRLAESLMNNYHVEEAELALAEGEGRIKIEVVHRTADVSALKGKKQHHKVVNCLTSIANFTDTKVVELNNGKIEYTGDVPDVEIANYLTSLIRNALDNEFENYKRNTPKRGYGSKASFQTSMANTIARRLNQMRREREEQMQEEVDVKRIEDGNGPNTSTALVVMDTIKEKKEQTEKQFRDKYPKLRTTYTSSRVSNGNAFSAGAAAGKKVHLGKSIGQSQRKALA